MEFESKNYSIEAYLRRLPISIVKNLLGSMLHFEKKQPLNLWEKSYKATLIKVLQEQNEPTDLDPDKEYYPSYEDELTKRMIRRKPE